MNNDIYPLYIKFRGLWLNQQESFCPNFMPVYICIKKNGGYLFVFVWGHNKNSTNDIRIKVIFISEI